MDECFNVKGIQIHDVQGNALVDLAYRKRGVVPELSHVTVMMTLD